MGAEKRPRHQRPPAREHRQPPQRHFLLMEQVIAPIDLRPQRLLPTRCPAAAARQEPEAVIQALRDFFDRQPHVGGRRRPAGWAFHLPYFCHLSMAFWTFSFALPISVAIAEGMPVVLGSAIP